MLEQQAKAQTLLDFWRNVELKLNPVDNEVVRMDLNGKGVSEGKAGATPGPLEP